jgi:hypothetical protein
MPERLELRAMKNRDMRATLDLCSPSDGACLRVLVTRYTVAMTPYQTPRGRIPVFPATFLDLARVVEIARGLGFDGGLKRASIGLGSPNWGLQFTGGQRGTAGLVLDGVTGKRITVDINAVMADYNRQWDEAIANLRRMSERNSTGAEVEMCKGSEYRHALTGECGNWNGEFLCEKGGGNWQYGSCANY